MIQFLKSLPRDKVLWAFNNNTIKYKDPIVHNAEWSDIDCGLFSVRLYPDPDQNFTFNFVEYLRKVIITNNFEDTQNFNITPAISSLVYNGTPQTYLELTATITVSNTDGNGDPFDLPLRFMAGVLQIEDFKRGGIPQDGLFFLMPQKAFARTHYKLNYWPGYPFDISVYAKSPGVLSARNLTNNVGIALTVYDRVSRIAFCDGNHDETIEDHLPLSFGHNIVKFSKHQLPQSEDLFVDIEKHEPRCGVYVKYRNQFGGWSYWLFHQNHNRSRSVKDGDELENDWHDIGQTNAPTLQTGVESSQDTIKCLAKGLSADDVRQLGYILESPKIYLYAAERYSQGTNLSIQANVPMEQRWIEIKCGTKKLDIRQPKKNRYSFSLDFALPARYRISLL